MIFFNGGDMTPEIDDGGDPRSTSAAGATPAALSFLSRSA